MSVIQMTKDELLARLREQLEVAERYDADVLKQHQVKEQATLREFKERVKAASKWTYADLKSNGYEVGISYRERERCPDSKAHRIKLAIRRVELDRRVRYALNDTGISRDLFSLVVWEPQPESSDVC